MEFLTQPQQKAVLDKVLETVHKKLVTPNKAAPDVKKLRDENEPQLLGSGTPEEFEQAINSMLQTLGTSHTGFFHQNRPRASGRVAIAATFTKAVRGDN